ncbi:MAG: glycosyltransferase family 9 protein [Elusimicrobiota bacterium]|jgi:ADP-heptose:LPS heptosyltransferase|nr:glycosyltransferase family 9 protein [Elusimicrobiota bacterium]
MKLNEQIRTLKKTLAKFILDTRKKSGKDLPDFSNLKTALFLRDDNKIGDMVISSLLFREFKKRRPVVKLLVLCGQDNKEIIKYNPFVDEIIEKKNGFLKNWALLRNLRKRKIDIVFDFFFMNPKPAHLAMLKMLNPQILIGFHKSQYNIYDISLETDTNKQHISKIYEFFLKTVGIENPSLCYEIFLDKTEEENAKQIFAKSGAKYKIVINPFSASRHRSLSVEKLKNLIALIDKEADCSFYILAQEKNCDLLKNFENNKIFIFKGKTIRDCAALIKHCSLVITPDTSIVHIAAAFKKNTIALYRGYSFVEEKTDIVWGANNPNAVQLNVNTKNGSIKNDIENIDNILIVNEVKKILDLLYN